MDSCSPFWTAHNGKCLKEEKLGYTFSQRERLSQCACQGTAILDWRQRWLLACVLQHNVQFWNYNHSNCFPWHGNRDFFLNAGHSRGTTASGPFVADKDAGMQRRPWMNWRMHSFQSSGNLVFSGFIGILFALFGKAQSSNSAKLAFFYLWLDGC